MTEGQKETLRFYTTNDYLLINGLLWGEDEKTIDIFIQLINNDGRGLMAEAIEQGFDVRWNCSKEEGERLYQIYQKRFPVMDNENVKAQILDRAKNDIFNMISCMTPLTSEMVLYRNINTGFVDDLEEGMSVNYLGFSSCSLNPHVAEDATYGVSECTLVEIVAPAGTHANYTANLQTFQQNHFELILASFYL